MHIQERFIVPAFGVLILLSSFILSAPLVYQLLLGLLGLAAAGTYAAPPRVQVEARIAIAVAGLIILLIVSSAAFWLTLLSFGAIAALQIPHRHTLQRQPATIAWLRAVLDAARERGSGWADAAAVTGTADAPDEEAGAAAADGGAESVATDREQAPKALPGVESLPALVRVSVAGIGSLVVGVVVVVSVFLPWVGFLISGYGETLDGPNLTLRAAAQELELPALSGFFGILIVIGVASMISIALPRVVAAGVAAVGLAVTLASYIYVVTEVERGAAELSSLGVSVTALPAAGALLAGLCFLAMFVLQLVGGANRSLRS